MSNIPSTGAVKDPETRRVLDSIIQSINSGDSTALPSFYGVDDPQVKGVLSGVYEKLRGEKGTISSPISINELETKRILEYIINNIS